MHVVFLNLLPSKVKWKLFSCSNASSRKDYIPQILTVLLEVVRVYIWPKTMLLQRRPISASDQIPDRFYAISMEFLSLSRRRSSARTSSAAKSEEKRMFSQATMHNRCFVVAGSVNFAMLDFHLQFTNNRGGSLC